MTELLPAKAGLLYVYAAVGAVGGVAAAANKDALSYPSLWAVLRRSILGGATGLGVGALGLARLGAEDADVFWTIFACCAGGFVGPYALWEMYRKFRGTAADPQPPSPPKGLTP